VKALEVELGVALRAAADAEAARAAAAPSAAVPDAALALQLAERDQRISRLQREVADKTDRLGRLAKEMGELKAAKGLGKIFR
jgi:hypothetical protein